jgi:hypothetical protein
VRAAALAVAVLLVWAPGAAAAIHGNVNVNYFSSDTDTEGQQSTSTQSLLQNYLLDVEGPITPKVGYAGYLRATRVEQSTTIGGSEIERFLTTIEPELQLNLRDPIYNVSSGYRRSETWTGADFDNDERETSNFYFVRAAITPLRLPVITLQYDRLESFDHRNPMELDQVDNNILLDLNYVWQAVRTYYSFNYLSTENNAPGLLGSPEEETTTINHLGRVDYADVFGAGRFPLAVSYQVNSFDTDVSGTTSGGAATSLIGVSPGFALANQPAGPRFTDLTLSATISVSLSETGRNIGFQLSAAAICDRIILDLDQLGAGTPVTWQVYARNVGDSSWSFLAETDVARSGNTYTIDFNNSQSFAFYKVVNTTVDLGSRVAGVRAFRRETAGTGPSVNTLSQSLNFNAGAQVVPELALSFNFFLDTQDREPDNYLSSLGNLFPSLFESSTGRPGGPDSSSSVNRTFGPSVRWLPVSWAAATFNYQRLDSFDSEGLSDIGGNTYSAIFNVAALDTLDVTLSYVRSEQEVTQQLIGQPDSQTSTVSDSYLASFTARLLEGLDYVGDFGYTTTGRESRDEPTVETEGYFLHGAVNAQWTPKLFSTLSYTLNWSYTDGEATVTRLGSFVLSWRPTARFNTAYTVTGSMTGDSRLMAQSLAFDWLVLPAIHLHTAGTLARTWPEGVLDQTAVAQVVYYVNRYADFQAGYSYNRTDNLVETTSHSFNLFFNGRF